MSQHDCTRTACRFVPWPAVHRSLGLCRPDSTECRAVTEGPDLYVKSSVMSSYVKTAVGQRHDCFVCVYARVS